MSWPGRFALGYRVHMPGQQLPRLPAYPAVLGADGAGSWTPDQTGFIKKVIGLPGDHVQCCNAQDRITVNGVPLHEPYLYPGSQPSSAPADVPGRFSVLVPPGKLWVLGDHRSVSGDSRVPESSVIGQAFMVAWPPGQWRTLS